MLLQLPLFPQPVDSDHTPRQSPLEDRQRFRALLQGDLDFHGQEASPIHRVHPFPAKFPPALPRLFIQHLTRKGDLVLDPMMGSGTTVVEAAYSGRVALGGDIDPLALLLTQAKCNPISPHLLARAVIRTLRQAEAFMREGQRLQQRWETGFDEETRRFLDYWFLPETQKELLALSMALERETDPGVRMWLRITFSGIIIAKGGSVALARDLSHTRPHRVAKTPRSAFVAFRERGMRLAQILGRTGNPGAQAKVLWQGDAQALPLPANRVRLIVTSPPYAGNAIDYMRAHKFTLVWWGYSIRQLGALRREYIGGETTHGVLLEPLPDTAQASVQHIAEADPKKGKVLHRYYSEMRRVFLEMARVLQPGGFAVIIVGESTMRGRSARVPEALAAIGQQVGLEWIHTGVRRLDRNRRMMPTRHQPSDSQIERRMHQEYVLGFMKPGRNG